MASTSIIIIIIIIIIMQKLRLSCHRMKHYIGQCHLSLCSNNCRPLYGEPYGYKYYRQLCSIVNPLFMLCNNMSGLVSRSANLARNPKVTRSVEGQV
jgi:hypothetical protein